jgi:hypothetical protein
VNLGSNEHKEIANRTLNFPSPCTFVCMLYTTVDTLDISSKRFSFPPVSLLGAGPCRPVPLLPRTRGVSGPGACVPDERCPAHPPALGS